MKLISIGFGSMVSMDRVIAVITPDSAPVKRLIQESRERGMLIDATYGRKTASVFVMDSDHVVLFDDELREIMKEIVRNDALDKVLIGLDFFDASINRVAAWVVGTRNARKGLLYAMLQPDQQLRAMQDAADFTGRMVMMEAVKTLPFGDVWEELCRREGVPVDDSEWFAQIRDYEKTVLEARK